MTVSDQLRAAENHKIPNLQLVCRAQASTTNPTEIMTFWLYFQSNSFLINCNSNRDFWGKKNRSQGNINPCFLHCHTHRSDHQLHPTDPSSHSPQAGRRSLTAEILHCLGNAGSSPKMLLFCPSSEVGGLRSAPCTLGSPLQQTDTEHRHSPPQGSRLAVENHHRNRKYSCITLHIDSCCILNLMVFLRVLQQN